MTKISTLITVLVLAASSWAPAQNLLKVTLDVGQMNNPDCWLNGGMVSGDKVYLHSGLCVSNPQFCTDSIMGFGSPVWEHVTGNWGNDDGIGQMTFQGNGMWELTIDLDTYHPAPNGSTPYTMGLVFRDATGGFEGKDDQCGDIFIKNLNGANPSVVQGSTNAPFPAVTATKVTSTSIQAPSILSAFSVSPNPSRGLVQLSYGLRTPAANMSAEVFNTLGQQVALLYNGKQQPGSHSLAWDASESGLYYVVLRNGADVLATDKILIQK